MRHSYFSSLRKGFQNRFLGLAAGAMALATVMSATPASAQQLWADEFNSGTFNSNGLWSVYKPSQSLQRTQFGLSPTMGSEGGVSFTRMPLRTYNSTYDASSPKTQSSEIFSNQTFKVGTGIEFESRLRSVNMPRGVVFGMYTYAEKGVWPDGYLKDEVDFEVLSNLPKNQFWSNVWNDWNSHYGNNNGVHNSDAIVSTSGMNYSDWTTYTARWYPDRMEWYVNGILARTATNVVPDDYLSVHFNMWNANNGWGTAYDAAMQPTNNPANNSECYMDIDYVRVKKLPVPTTGTWTNGDGLRADFYPQPNFGGTPVTRVDPRLYYDWKSYYPDVNIPADNFSARWTGSIVSPYTENVTLTLRADDGVRLYINNVLKIDDWISTAAKDRSITIPMTAGVKVPIKVEYFEGTGGASAMMYWSSPSMAKTVVPQSQLFSNDTTPPAISITTPGPGYSYRSLNATGTATDAANGISVVQATLKRLSDNQFWNGSAWTSSSTLLPAVRDGNSWSLGLSFLANGHYSITVSGVDRAGNTTNLPARDFWVDTLAPVVTITTPADGSNSTSLSSAAGTAIDGGPGAASVTTALKRVKDGFWWNGSAFTSAYAEVKATLTGSSWKLNFSSLVNSEYQLFAKSIDYGGNSGNWVTSDFTVGPAGASAVTITDPADGSNVASLTSASGTATDAGRGVLQVTTALQRTKDGTWWNGSAFTSTYAELKATLSGSDWTLTFPYLAKGGYKLFAKSTNYSGKVSPWTISAFTVGPPVVSALTITTPADGGKYASLTSATGEATDAAGIAAVTIAFQRKDGTWWNGSAFTSTYAEVRATLSGSTWKLNFPSPAANTYKIFAKSTTSTGKVSPWTISAFTVGSAAVSVTPPSSTNSF